MAEVACRLVVERTALVEPELETGPEVDALAALVDELDTRRFELGEAKGAELLFAQARAASAVRFALDRDPGRAADDALYEAIHAVWRRTSSSVRDLAERLEADAGEPEGELWPAVREALGAWLTGDDPRDR
jgi:hypothetical protein